MRTIISTIVREWKTRKLPEVLERKLDLKNEVGNKLITSINGFRRTGKTYLLLGLAQTLLKENTRDNIVYINFEDERVPLKTEFLTSLIPVLKEELDGQLKVLILDELQNIPLWSKWLRRVYDTEDIKLFITGSSSKLSANEIPTELRGRFVEKILYPLSFREFLKFKNLQANIEKTELKKVLREYLKFGGLPAVVLANEEQKAEILHNYYNTVIRRDIIERFKIKNEESLKALLNLLLNTTTYTISKMYNTLKSLNLEVGKSTTQTYLSHIENSYFIQTLKVFSFKMKDQLQQPRKIYLIDNGFITALSSKFSDNYGRLYENLVHLELKRRQTQNQEVFYWKNSQHEEADFIVKDGIKIKQVIQVCYELRDYDTKKREIKALLKAGKELKCNNLLAITEDQEGREKIKGKTICYTPLWKWLLEEE